MAKKPGSNDPEKNSSSHKRDPGSTIGIETLNTCLVSYTYVKNRAEPVFLTEVADQLELDLATFTRRIARFEDEIRNRGYAGFKLFNKVTVGSPSSGATQRRVYINKDRYVEEVLYNVRQVVEGWNRLVGASGIQHVSIKLGMSLSVARNLMPFLADKFQDYWIDIVQTKAERLHELARKGLCDLVLVEVAGDLARSQKERVFKFDLALIAPRGHWTESASIERVFRTGGRKQAHRINKEVDLDKQRHQAEPNIWQHLADHNDTLCLLTEDPALFPLPDYPNTSQLPDNLRVLRVGSTTLCNSMVMSSDISKRSLLTIGVPHFLTEDDLERIHIVPTESIGRPVHFALLRPGRPTLATPQNPLRTEAIDAVEQAIVTKLQDLERNGPIAGLRTRFIYHSTLSGKRAKWLRGNLSCREREVSVGEQTSNALLVKSVTGTHSGKTSDGKTYQYLVRGRIVIMKSGELHFVFRSRQIGNVDQDDYVATCILKNETQLNSGTFCGIWQGLFTCQEKAKSDTTLRFGSGVIVVSNVELNISDLNEFAVSYLRGINPNPKKNKLPIIIASEFD